MINKILLYPKFASALLERINEEDLPIILDVGDKEMGMIPILAEYDDNDLFENLLKEIANDIII